MTVASYQLPEVVSVAQLCAHSFRDFHVKGFDYLCLDRSDQRTVKAYFFEGVAPETCPEVVMPHNHRYDFVTGVLAGEVVNHNYLSASGRQRGDVEIYDEFAYATPLNGGTGFTWRRETALMKALSSRLTPASRPFHQRSRDIHTITVRPDTVISQVQRADVVPVGVPTKAFRVAGSRTPPDLDGLYQPMDADRAIQRLEQFYALAGVPMPRVVE